MTLNTSDGKLEEVRHFFERLYAYAQNEFSDVMIDRLIDLMEEYEGKILLLRKRLYG